MTRHQIIFVGFVCVAIVWTIIQSLQPGGGSIPWFLGFLLITLVSYYLGFVDKSLNPFRFWAQAGFVVSLMLTFLMAYLSRVEDKGLEEIAKYVAVYPNVESIHFIPRTSGKTIQHWQVTTGDAVKDINTFYSDRNNLRDWRVIITDPMLVLENDVYRLTITAAAQPRSSFSNIFYHIEHK